jgi:hypothetical protein
MSLAATIIGSIVVLLGLIEWPYSRFALPAILIGIVVLFVGIYGLTA